MGMITHHEDAQGAEGQRVVHITVGVWGLNETPGGFGGTDRLIPPSHTSSP